MYMYMYICSAKPNSLRESHWSCKKLQLACITSTWSPPEATVLQVTIKKHLNSASIVLTKQHYHCYYKFNPNGIT